jgi:hypothetical protein
VPSALRTSTARISGGRSRPPRCCDFAHSFSLGWNCCRSVRYFCRASAVVSFASIRRPPMMRPPRPRYSPSSFSLRPLASRSAPPAAYLQLTCSPRLPHTNSLSLIPLMGRCRRLYPMSVCSTTPKPPCEVRRRAGELAGCPRARCFRRRAHWWWQLGGSEGSTGSTGARASALRPLPEVESIAVESAYLSREAAVAPARKRQAQLRGTWTGARQS